MIQGSPIALTGTAGHIASSLIPLLLRRGYSIRGLVHHSEPDITDPKLQLLRGNLNDSCSLERLVEGCGAVIHCAAQVSIRSNRDRSVYQTNVEGTRRIFQVAAAAGVKRFVHVSSIHAYDQLRAGEVLDESSPYCSDRAPQYDRSKRDAQQFVLDQSGIGMEPVVVNPTAVIGPEDLKPSLLGQALCDFYQGKIPALIHAGFDFVDVRDVAEGIVSALERGRTGEAYLLPGRWHTLEDLHEAVRLCRGHGRKLPVLPVWLGFAGLPFAGILALLSSHEGLYTRESLLALVHGHKNVSGSKAERELEYRPRPLMETVRDTLEWFRKNGRIK